MNLRKLLVVIGVVWLALVVIYLIISSSLCPSACLNNKFTGAYECGCEIQGYGFSVSSIITSLLIYGLPSWILFLIATLIKSKSKKRKR